MDLYDFRFRHELDHRLSLLHAPDDVGGGDKTAIPNDTEAARALLGTISALVGHSNFATIARGALAAHNRYLRSDLLSYALCRDTALREAFPGAANVAYLDWAAVVLEAVRIQMGDAAFGPFLSCVVEAEDASAALCADRGTVCV
jgi:hypothetical protein